MSSPPRASLMFLRELAAYPRDYRSMVEDYKS